MVEIGTLNLIRQKQKECESRSGKKVLRLDFFVSLAGGWILILTISWLDLERGGAFFVTLCTAVSPLTLKINKDVEIVRS